MSSADGKQPHDGRTSFIVGCGIILIGVALVGGAIFALLSLVRFV